MPHQHNSSVTTQVEYVPPPREDIHRYAWMVCQHHHIDSHQMVNGLSEFLVLCASIQAKTLSHPEVKSDETQ